jgi:hypothetical protein
MCFADADSFANAWRPARPLRVLSNDCTASNSAVSTIGGIAISTISVSGLRSRVFQNFVLNRWRPI